VAGGVLALVALLAVLYFSFQGDSRLRRAALAWARYRQVWPRSYFWRVNSTTPKTVIADRDSESPLSLSTLAEYPSGSSFQTGDNLANDKEPLAELSLGASRGALWRPVRIVATTI
jgi:hypothetical protein